MAAGVHIACQNICHGVQAVGAGVADPQSGVHAVLGIIEEIALHGVGGVDQHDGACKLLLCHLQHLFFFVGQGQHIGAIHKIAVLQISTLTGHTGEHHDRSIAVGGKAGAHIGDVCTGCRIRSLDVRAVQGDGHFIDMPCRAVAQTGTLAGRADIVLACTVGVEVPQHRVHLKANSFQSLLPSGSLGGVDIGRAGTAGHNVHAGMAERRHLTARSQRQGVVIVFQQYSTLTGKLLCDFLIVCFQLFHTAEITLVIHGTVVLAHGLVGGGL